MNVAQASPRDVVRVELGPRSYDIVIGAGLIDQAGIEARRVTRRARLLVVTDKTVADLHGATLERALAAEGFGAEMIVLPAGEASKSFAELERLVGALLDRRPERGDVIAAFGGGVVGDLAGFAASILLRGVDFIQIPTTLLAQVDSSVGGKTGINARHGKNLVGSFHQPRIVICDTALIDTLPRRERLGGYAEIAKYGLIGDAGFFSWLEASGAAVIDRAGADRSRAVAASCRAKAAIVGADERETGQRALLNFGHTFGHAIEAESGYDSTFNHGEAVALGMALAFDLSAALGVCPNETAERVRRHFAGLGLRTTFDAHNAGHRFAAERLVQHMHADKKVRDGALTFILARRIGEAFVANDVPKDAVLRVLRSGGAA